MSGIAVSLRTSGTTLADLRRLERALDLKYLGPIIGRAIRNVIRDYLFFLNSTRPNALGGPRINFWAAAARATTFTFAGDLIVISIAMEGMAQQFYGGTIRPKTAKYLTIPARAEMHGKRAREVPGLHLLFNRAHPPWALADKNGAVMFILTKEVNQRPDSTALPTREVMQAAGLKAVESTVTRAVARQGGQP